MIKNFWQRPVVQADEHELRAYAALVAKMYEDSLVKRFIYNETDESAKSALRPSNLGKPAVDMFGARFFPELYEWGEVDPRTNHIFHMGDTWECDALFYMVQRGYTIDKIQPEINWRDMVIGHADATASYGDIPLVVEFKAVNNNYFKDSWDRTMTDYHLPPHLADHQVMNRLPLILKQIETSANINNRRGYITQASIYADALNRRPMLMMLNKDTAEVIEAPIPRAEFEAAIHRVEQIADAWFKVDCWEDVFQFIKPPPVRKEYKDRKWTGRYMPHISMYNSPIIDLVYEVLPDVDGKIIVVDYRYPEKYIHLKPELPR